MYGYNGPRQFAPPAVQQSGNALLDQAIARVSFYQDVHRLKTDVDNLLRGQRALRPKVDTFQGRERQQVTLFYLHGTIPIVFSGSSYNIPMTIYFDPPYPYQPPRVFVSPTAGMGIKPKHKHVDQKGMVFLPYLNQWNPHFSNPTELIQQVAGLFSQDPPVYAQPKEGAAKVAAVQPSRGTVIAGSVVVKSNKEKLLESLNKKAQERMPEILKPIIDDINKELDMEDGLVQHRTEVDSRITDFKAEATKIDRFLQELDDTEVNVKGFLEKNASQDFDVVAFLEPHDPLSRQLLDLIAEDLSQEDILIFLEDNLASRRITPEVFLESVRETCRKQYHARELKNKVIRSLWARQITAGTSGEGGGR